MFSSLPKTREVVEMKLNMLENMEEKFQELLKEGKNENEAVGIVLADFGSIEELKQELGISGDTPENQVSEQQNVQNDALHAEFFAFKKKFGIAIAVAVGLFIFAPAMYVIFESLYGESSKLALGCFFFLIACGVGICIYFGIQNDKYKELLHIKEDDHKDRKGISGLIASIVFPLATIIFLCLGFFGDLWHPGWIVFPIAGMLVGISDSIFHYKNGK